jgi:ribosome-binding protein aMBF1 (putative translation factor)
MNGAYDVLARIRANRGEPEPAGERCDMCSERIDDEHQHVVNLQGRQLMCVCRACYLLFTDTDADLRYRAIPDRYLAFEDFALDRRRWEALQIPVGLAHAVARLRRRRGRAQVHWRLLRSPRRAQQGRRA